MYNFASKNIFIMAYNNIRKLINLFGENSLYTLSWGINGIKERMNGVEFHVQGYKYHGVVVVDENNGKYLVRVGNSEYSATYSNLIEILDELVESEKNPSVNQKKS